MTETSQTSAPEYGTLTVRASGLPGMTIGTSRDYQIPLTEAALHWACQSFGAPSYGIDLRREAVMMAAYRASALELCLEAGVSTPRRRDLGDAFDPSEVANVSYWLGMAAGMLVAEWVLGVQYLFHAESFRRAGYLVPRALHSKRLADLVGWDQAGGVHVIEAKARKIAGGRADKAKWKGQATSVKTLNGIAPTTQSYVVIWGRDGLQGMVDDPPSTDDDPVDLIVEPGMEGLREAYYAPFRSFLDLAPVDEPRGPVRDMAGDERRRGADANEQKSKVGDRWIRSRPTGVITRSGRHVFVGLDEQVFEGDGLAASERVLGYRDGGRAFVGRNGVVCLCRGDNSKVVRRGGRS